MAAADPRVGWVPEPIEDSHELVGRNPLIPPTTDLSSDPGQSVWIEPHAENDHRGVGQASDSAATTQAGSRPASGRTGRHRGGSGERGRFRWDPGLSAGRALSALAVIAVLLAAGLTWWSRPQPSAADAVETLTPPLAETMAGTVEPTGSAAGTGTGGSSDPPDSGDPLVVSVIGQVHRPGLVSVPDGSRVADVISAAGGALPEADLSTVNLARLVVDGEQIAVGVPGSSLPEGAGSTGPSAGLVDLNTASLAELEELPGIGPVLAERIIDLREENGGFTDVEQLREVSGIGPSVYEGLVDLVTV